MVCSFLCSQSLFGNIVVSVSKNRYVRLYFRSEILYNKKYKIDQVCIPMKVRIFMVRAVQLLENQIIIRELLWMEQLYYRQRD